MRKTRVSQLFFTTRRAFWHARHGGLRQVKRFLQGGQHSSPQIAQYRRAQLDASSHKNYSEPFEAVAARNLTDSDSGYTLTFLPTRPVQQPFSFEGLKVGVILDDFSAQAWGSEFKTVSLTPQQWREQLDENTLDFLFVESAWAGSDGAWTSQLTGPSAPSSSLISLIAECKARKIPTVFWNKEDPPHFEDFLDTARLFDHVFTSDSRMVMRYKEELGHNRVGVLPFAAQPAIHNPVRPLAGVQDRGVAFAGSYFAHKFPERREQLDYLLPAAQKAASKSYQDFEIYSRFFGLDEKYQFPQQFRNHVVGALPYEQILTAYKAHKVFLNVNSVVDSPSMCARRIFEILASGTPVVSAPSAAVREFFPDDELMVAGSEREAELQIRALLNSEELRSRMVHKAQRRIWAKHTYTHRAKEVLEAIGIEVSPSSRSFGSSPLVSVLVSTMRPQQVDHVLQTVAAQQGAEVELLLLAHGFSWDESEVLHRANALGLKKVKLLSEDASKSLGYCMNRLVEASEGQVLAKMDDDDLYGEFYLLDMVNALHYSGADLVGKNARYVFLEESSLTALRNPHLAQSLTHFVAGPTLVGWRQTFVDYPFADVTRGEDTDFLGRLVASGKTIFSADPFNFVQVRSASGHTWDADDLEFLANSRVIGFGTQPLDVFF